MSQLVSACAVGILLLLGGGLLWMRMGLEPVVDRLQGEEVITAYVDPSVNHENEKELVDQIRVSLGALAVSDGAAPSGAAVDSFQLKLVTAQDFAGHLKDKYPELYRELEDLSSEMQGIVPRYVSISGMLPDHSLEAVRAVTGEESVESSKNRYRHSVGAFMALRKVSGFLALGIGLALITGLIHLSRSNALIHQDSLKLLKLWGASIWVLRAPGILSAASIGIIGGVLALIGWLVSSGPILQTLRVLSPMFEFMPQARASTGFLLLGAGILIGVIAGVIGRDTV